MRIDLQPPEGLDLSQIPSRSPAERVNDVPGSLNLIDGIDCPICKNRGYIAIDTPDGDFSIRDCECRKQRAAYRKLKASGLQDLIRVYSFKSYKTPDPWSFKVKETAGAYVAANGAPWFAISGSPGTGKTHICTAICRRLLRDGAGVRYMLWREEAPALKAIINDPAYEIRFRELAGAEVLYIDDFLKGKISDADMNLAFSLINARYNARSKRTILSSELSLAEISRLDPAVSERIYQRARGYILHAPRDAKNWRTEEENA